MADARDGRDDTDERAPDAARRTPTTHEALEGGPTLRSLGRGGEALQQLRHALERVGQERSSLMRVASSLEEIVRSQEGRYAELEQELNDTALLYVASYQLQARSEPKDVLRHVRELLEQLIGVESFVLYLAGSDGRALPVASKGLGDGELPALRMSEQPLLDAVTQRVPVVGEQVPNARGTVYEPLAVVPLMLGERVIGAITVVTLFAHKAAWASVDHQLLQLLSTHAASALVAAHLVHRQGDILSTLAGLGESLR